MAGLSISPPSVEVIQQFVSTSPVVSTPSLASVIVGPAMQVVSAFSDLGAPQASAFAGNYRDGQGLVAYDLPSLVTEASLVGFESSVRVFLLNGAVTRELNPVSGEIPVIDNAVGDYAIAAPPTLTDVSQTFLQSGIEVGDVVRFAFTDPGASGYLGETVDIPITAVISDTVLELTAGIVTESLPAHTYDIVRSPAEFVFNATQQANAEIGSVADYVTFTATSLKADGVTVSDYVGAAGDQLSIAIEDSQHFIDGTDGAVGDAIFYSGTLATVTPGTGNFLTSVGARGDSLGKLLLVGGAADTAVLRDVLQVVSDAELIIESGQGVGLSAQVWAVGDDSNATYGAGTGATDVIGTTLTVTAGDFLTSVPNAAGTPSQTTYVELTTGVYAVTAVVDDNTLTITGTAATVSLAAQNPVILLQTSSGADGATGALTSFATIAGDLTTLAGGGTEAINFGGTIAAPLTSVSDADNATVGVGAPAVLTSGSSKAYSAVLLVQPLTLLWDSTLSAITVSLQRGGTTPGISGSTYKSIVDAITLSTDASYNVLVADAATAVLGGTTGTGLVSLLEADVGTKVQFDGGSAAEQLLLDADLIGSATPVGQVYVSYKALRIDLSPASVGYQGASYIENEVARQSILGDATLDNPLGLAVSIALTNSPGKGIYAMGIDSVTTAEPDGAKLAYDRALTALEAESVHLLVLLTSADGPMRALKAHVVAMSVSTQKAERVGFGSSNLPSYAAAVVGASGVLGNGGTGGGVTPSQMTGLNPAEFRTSVDLSAAGIAVGDILVVSALSGAATGLTSVNGTNGPLYGLPVATPPVKVGDNFVLQVDASSITDVAWDSLIDVDWSVYTPGAAISQLGDVAERVAVVSESYAERRFFRHWPDQATAIVNGTEQLLPGYYIAAMWAGRANAATPAKGLSSAGASGLASLRHSSGYFNKAQLDRIAGGGTWISTQAAPSAAVVCRHQLSTDVSSIEKREFSITRALDYTAFYLRDGLRGQTGQFNITSSYLDSLSARIQGMLGALVDSNILGSADLVSLGVSATSPDKIEVVVAVKPLFPANYIQITIEV